MEAERAADPLDDDIEGDGTTGIAMIRTISDEITKGTLKQKRTEF